jgi:hypothetical protein
MFFKEKAGEPMIKFLYHMTLLVSTDTISMEEQ